LGKQSPETEKVTGRKKKKKIEKNLLRLLKELSGKAFTRRGNNMTKSV